MQYSDETGAGGASGTLMIHLLGRCNLECLHCYMDGSPRRREELPVHRVIEAIAECGELGVGNVYLTGGEPLLYTHLAQVIEAASKVKGIGLTVCTNGMLLRQHHVDMLRAAGASVNISVDGDEKLHDELRHLPGAYRATIKGIRIVAENGVPFRIIATMSHRNVHLLADMVEWAAREGASEFRVQPLLRLGRGIQICDDRLTNDELNLLILQLTDLANRYRSRGLTCALTGVTKHFLTAHPCGAYVCNGTGCHRRISKEIKKLVVREDGTVLPEATNLSHEFALGNIADGPLVEMVKRYFENGYHRFDQLCRTAYAEILPTWESVIVPWDQIIAERSRTWRPAPDMMLAPAGCGSSCRSPAESISVVSNTCSVASQ